MLPLTAGWSTNNDMVQNLVPLRFSTIISKCHRKLRGASPMNRYWEYYLSENQREDEKVPR